MPLIFSNKRYGPSDMSRVLSEDFGHKVTPYVIRKWDNLILSKVINTKREKGEARTYTKDDLLVFNAIATLRNLGYGISDIKQVFASSSVKPDIMIKKGNVVLIAELKHRVTEQAKRQLKAYELLGAFLEKR